jgi:hypothetical protein
MFRLFTLALVFAFGSGVVQFANQTAALRAKFMKEADPVRKARVLGPLADAEFHDMQQQLAADNSAEAGVVARQLSEEAQDCRKALDAKVKDPEKHPSGYKELQISVRQSLRRIDNIVIGLPGDEQKPFLDVRKDLDQMDRELIHELFPLRPADPTAPGAPKT